MKGLILVIYGVILIMMSYMNILKRNKFFFPLDPLDESESLAVQAGY
jgi:hypothetical protein